MSDDQRLTELMLRWEELRGQGREVTAQDLCHDCPDQAPEIARRIEALQAVYHALETVPSPATATETTRPDLYDFLAPPQSPDEMGRLGPYRVFKVLGSGGMGVVFQAEDFQLKRMVALKALLPTLAASDSARKRFLREAQATAAIDHINIVPIFQVGEDRGVPFLAMPLLQGETLEDRIKRQSSLPHPEVLRIGREIAQGLAAAHSRRLVHRDIKPANVWLEAETGRVKILDFGLARVLGSKSSLTQQGAILGTPSYMAPEQVEGAGVVDERCDLFSLGAVLYVLCTGIAPFQREDVVSSLLAVATYQPRPPAELKPEIPQALSALIMQLLAKNPNERPGSANAVVEAVRAIQEGQTEAVHLPPGPHARSVHGEPFEEKQVLNAGPAPFNIPPPLGKRRWFPLPRPGIKTLGLWLALGLLAAAFCVWAFFFVGHRYQPVYLALIGAGYEDNLAVPHNVYGMNGLKGLEAVADENKDQYDVAYSSPDDWKDSLKTFKSEGKRKTIVLYLALHGGADQDGPFLIFDHKPLGNDSKSVLRLDTVFKELGDLPDDKNKLLILDATQPRSVPRLMIHNDFSRQLVGLNEQIKKIPRLVVINSTDAFQRSWASEEWRQTAFGHYLQEGLKGAPDLHDGDRVNVLSLYTFVHERVRRWAHDNRDRGQTPILLPRGEEGRDRAKAIDLTVVKTTYQPPKLADTPRALPGELQSAWADAEDLLGKTPSPAVYSPHLLTRYLESLVRYEQLVRAGANGPARDLKSKLDDFRKELISKRGLRLESAPSSLPLPAVLGLLDNPDLLAGADTWFDELWKEPNPRKRMARWRAIQDKRHEDPLLKARLSGWLFQKAVNHLADLPKASEILKELVSTPRDRPTEAHHMLMWQGDWQYLYGKPVPDDFSDALRLRGIAEEIALGDARATYVGKLASARHKPNAGIVATEPFHPFSEIVQYWIQAKVDEADKKRRDAQDLLFATPEDRQRARTLIKEAEDLYLEARDIAVDVGKALATRAEVMAYLPYYSRWLPESIPTENEAIENQAIIEQLTQLEDLWRHTHQLNVLLENKPAEAPGDAKRVELRNAAQEVANRFKKLKDGFTSSYQKYQGNPGQLTQKDWHALQEALACPLIFSARRRLELVNLARKVSLDLNWGTKEDVTESLEHSKTKNYAQTAAYRRGRVELAILGEGWFKRTNAADHRRFGDVQHDLEAIPVSRWEEHANAVGNQTGLRWREMADNINSLAQTSRTRVNLSQATQLMAEAARYCRQIDGAGADQVQNPVEEYRRLDMHHLLLWLAERTRQDRCFAADNRPYYQQIGLRFVNDAQELAGEKNTMVSGQRIADAKKKGRELRETVSLSLAWSLHRDAKDYNKRSGAAQVDVTSEQHIDLYYKVKAENLASGYPVVYVWPNGIEAADKKQFEESQQPHWRQISNREDPPLAVTGLTNKFYNDLLDPTKPPSTTVEVAPRKFEAKGLFRGYRFNRPTELYFYPRANTIIAQHPLPNRAAFLVYASDELHKEVVPGKGAVAILVDYSGSMDFKTKSGSTRIKEARAALGTMLKNLPANLEVSLWVFGGKTNRDSDLVENVAHVEHWKRGVNGNARRFMALLNKQKPIGGTPLLRAMSEAADQLRGVKKDKRRTMIVVTDGVPNERDKDVVSRLVTKIFDKSKIAVHVIGFHTDEISGKVDQEGAEAILPVFRDCINGLKEGKFHEAPDAEKLSTALDYALRWKYYLGVRYQRDPNKIHNVSRAPDLDNWVKVEPGYWDFWEDRLFPEKKQRVKLDAGELRLFEITQDGLRIGSFINRFAPAGNQAWPKELGWRMAARDNELISNRAQKAQEILVMLENVSPEHSEAPPPGQLWLELQHLDGTPVRGQRWDNCLGYPVSAAWRVHATHPEKQCRVQAWVRDTRLPTQRVQRAGQPLTAFNLEVTVQGFKVRVESVQIESFKMVDQKGRLDPKREMYYLVVRLDYPVGQPVLVEPYPFVDPAKGGGYQHHYYTIMGSKRGKYTGIFWYGDLTRPQLEQKVQALGLYSVEVMKKTTVTTRQMVVSFPTPPKPNLILTPRFSEELGFKR